MKGLRDTIGMLVDRWADEGISPSGGVSIHDISTIERRYSLVIPLSFQEYLITVNGMRTSNGSRTYDSGLISFWTLREIKPLYEVLANRRPKLNTPDRLEEDGSLRSESVPLSIKNARSREDFSLSDPDSRDMNAYEVIEPKDTLMLLVFADLSYEVSWYCMDLRAAHSTEPPVVEVIEKTGIYLRYRANSAECFEGFLKAYITETL